MAIKKQSMTVTLSHDGDKNLSVSMKFSPGLRGTDSQVYKNMDTVEKYLQYQISNLGAVVMAELNNRKEKT